MAGQPVTRRRDKDKCPACGKTNGCTCELDADFASLAEEYTALEQTAAQIKRLASLVAVYYTTLIKAGVDEDAAMMLTQTWCELNVTVEAADDEAADEGGDDDE